MIKIWIIITFVNYGYASAGHEIGPYYSEAACEAARTELLAKIETHWDEGPGDEALCIWREVNDSDEVYRAERAAGK